MYILYLSKTKIEVFKKENKISEVSWSKDNLVEVLGRLKSTFSSKFKVLLADDFISITSLLVSKKESKKRKFVLTKAQPIISQDLNQTTWDYKVVANLGKSKLVQIIYLNKDFFDQFRIAIHRHKIKIKLVESLSTGISRFLSKNKLTFVLFQNLVIISFNQTPIFSKVLDKPLTQDDINQVFAFTKERFNILPQQIIFSPTGDTAFSPYDFASLNPEYLDLNPITGLIHSSNIIGPDDSTTRLEIKSPQPIIINQSSLAQKIAIILAVCIFLIVGLLVSSKKIFNKNTDYVSPVVENIPQNTPTLIPTTNIDSLKIQVLNGSGVAGEATKVSTLLSQNKFKVTNTGNAPNYDYVKTEIQAKKLVSAQIIDLLVESLEKDYTSTVSATKLVDSSEYDIVVTIGKTK
ncbi:MAG: LytR C-terminal domain-containing protein [Candidatus Shapirobacteria bacterium]|jgi:hypothetical protein|nr:LytR C-terminal domain-containing protein [Candidatus Shapirobacteria bacterium]